MSGEELQEAESYIHLLNLSMIAIRGATVQCYLSGICVSQESVFAEYLRLHLQKYLFLLELLLLIESHRNESKLYSQLRYSNVTVKLGCYDWQQSETQGIARQCHALEFQLLRDLTLAVEPSALFVQLCSRRANICATCSELQCSWS